MLQNPEISKSHSLLLRGLPILSISISIVFLILLPLRLWHLQWLTTKTSKSKRGKAKAIIASLLPVTRLAILTVLLLGFPARDIISILSGALSFLAAAGLFPLSLLEHQRSIRPSDLAVLYLLASLASDILFLAVLLSTFHYRLLEILIAAQCSLEAALLFLESLGKQSILAESYQKLAPEEAVSILSRVFFFWINGILLQGSRQVLKGHDLPAIDRNLSSERLRRAILQAWSRRAKPETRTTLPKVLASCFFWPLVSAILPRLFLIMFRFAQPLLIRQVIRFILNDTLEDRATDLRFTIVLISLTIYAGMAVSTAIYQHCLNRLKVMIRGALVGLIHHRSLNVQSATYSDGKSLTLMNTDVDSLSTSAEMLHETWAHVLEVIIGSIMLAMEVGPLWPTPWVIIFFCSRVSLYMARNLRSKQKAWNDATQARISMTSSILGSMKSIKILGISVCVGSQIQHLREKELDMAERVRWMMVAYNSSANALGIFSPAITLVLFAVFAHLSGTKVKPDTAFTTSAILGMVTHPANMIMTIVPRAVASFASVERIQTYLLESSRYDRRIDLSRQTPDQSHRDVRPLAVRVSNLKIDSPQTAQPILQDINFDVTSGSIVVCSGPVGSGKTTLARAILGEICPTSGAVSVISKRIAFCSQTPWLPSTSIKKIIQGYPARMREDTIWYREVIRCCCLDKDLDAFPEGDETGIGSRGLNLSGGQRQRIALARAVYARCDITVLDDSFTALDGTTEVRVIGNLLGTNGIFKRMGTTVFWVTNASQYFHLADLILILDKSRIQEQGDWRSLSAEPGEITKFMLDKIKDSKNVSKQSELPQLKNQPPNDAVIDLKRKTGDLSLYGYYFKSAGVFNVLLLGTCCAGNAFGVNFPQQWIKLWMEAAPESSWLYVSGLLVLGFIGWLSTSSSMWTSHIRIAPHSGKTLHTRLLCTVLGAPLSFFSKTDNGNILNRFGQDIQLVDRELPAAFLSLINQIFKLIVQAGLLFAAQKLVLFSLPFSVLILYIVQKVYLQTSRQLRLLELESRSAVLTSFMETIDGVTTIRAFGWQDDAEVENIERLNESQQPFYILFCLQRWLNLVLDLLVAAIAIAVITLAVFLKGSSTGGQIGVALNMIVVANTTLVRLVQSWTTLEISLGAISRLKTMEEEVPSEDKPWEDSLLPGDWPFAGAIEFNDVTAAYDSDNAVLHGLTMSIKAGQTIVICGRTGSGKSTTLLTLLRLLEIQHGTIKIDGMDITNVRPSLVRQRCFITVPQDPLILSEASLKFNIDPLEVAPKSSIIEALIKTRLWQHFTAGIEHSDDEESDILALPVCSLPVLSEGQFQLFALARALVQLRSSELSFGFSESREHGTKSIVLFDEPTSSLDPETESMIFEIMREEFMSCGHTVIVVAHRLSFITQNMRPEKDLVAVMENGRLKVMGSMDEVLSLGLTLDLDE